MSDRFLLRRDRVVQAGAGTGKTHALLTQYLHLCAGLSAHGAPLLPRAICALTFTDKAAGEMRERLQRRTSAIVRAIAGTAASEVPAVLRQLQEDDLVQTAAALGRPLPGQELWEQVLAQLPGAPIGTFHSFAASLLRRYAALAGLDPDFALLDEDGAGSLLLEAGERVVLQALEGRLTEGPDGEDGPGAQAADGAGLSELAALVVGEYGFSGGPSVEGGVVEALCRLHRLRSEEGKDAAGIADSYRAPALTAELARIRSAIGAGLAALCQLAAELGAGSAERVGELGELRAGLLAQLQELDETSLAAAQPLCELMLQGLKKLRAKKDAAGTKDELAQIKERLKTAAEEVSALRAGLRAAPLAFAVERLLAPVGRAYDRAKQAAGALDFTDLLRKTRDLLRDHAAVRAEAQARFAVLLVDEFQDTNPLQAELLELLVGPLGVQASASAAPREPGRLYIVGDRKQSIYEFRGADVAAYTNLCDRLVAGGADQETLSRSYRSRPAVLHLVSALFADVMRSAAVPTVTTYPPPLYFVHWDAQRDPLHAVRPADPALPQPVELVRGAPPKDPKDAEPPATELPATAPPAAAAEPPAIDREADLLAQRILALRDEGAPLGDMVVLLRRFTHLFRYTLALKRAGIAHYVVRGRGFYQAQEVLDVTALLTLLSDPEDRLALLTVLRSPLCALSDDSLLRLHLGGRLTLPALLREQRGPQQRPPDEASASDGPRRSDNPSDPGDPGEFGDFSESLLRGELDEEEPGPPLELLGEERAWAPGASSSGPTSTAQQSAELPGASGAAGLGSAGTTTHSQRPGERGQQAHAAGPRSSPLGHTAKARRSAGPELELPADEAARLRRLLDLIAVLLRLGDRIGPSACLQTIYDHTDLLAILAADPDGEQRVANLLQLHERARQFDTSGGLRGFVRALRLATDPQLQTALSSPGDEPAAQLAGEADDVVRIMTVHQAKGLEFPIVLVAGCTTRERTDVPAVAYDRAVGLGLTVYEDGDRVRTLAALKVDANARLRASAESARLFYVAATRARERLIFLGETGPRPRLAGTWRAHLDALLAASEAPAQPMQSPPPLAPWHPGPLSPPPAPAPLPGSAATLLRAAQKAAALVYGDYSHPVTAPAEPATETAASPLSTAAAAPEGLSASDAAAQLPAAMTPVPATAAAAAPLVVTAAAMAPVLLTAAAVDLLICPRRFHLRTTARLLPPGPVARPAWSDEAAGEPVHVQLHTGSLAAQLLAVVDPDGEARDLDALLLCMGLDATEPRVAELRAHLQRLLTGQRRRGSTLGALFAAEPGASVQRAVPYAVVAAGGAMRLRGIIDVLHRKDAPEGPIVTALDYHYGCAPESEGPLHAGRRALLALAAFRLHPEARQLRTGLCFLREADPEPVLQATDPAELPAVESALLQAAAHTRLTLPAALRLPVLAAATCASLGCEYQPLCHARQQAARTL